MKVKDINIKGVGAIMDLELSFNDKANIICGPNSIGKTTILECIAHSFSFNSTRILKRNYCCESGTITTSITIGAEQKQNIVQIKEFLPENNNYPDRSLNQASMVIFVKTKRDFGYNTLNAIAKDKIRDDNSCCNYIEDGINIFDAKNWFINRYLFLDKPNALSDSQKSNYNLALKCFSALNPNYQFSRVKGDSFDIMINTPYGEIYYEYLSSGFKSIIFILFGIIQEIELRFKDPTITAEDFDGIILIDEIELHLHPEWQVKILAVLTDIFPNAQFFVTTHSPHVIQCADPNQIVALEDTGNGIAKREIPNSEYGYKGWTIEEILTDVMGMHDTRSETYDSTVKEFEKALEDDNRDKAIIAFDKLSKMLHPDNITKKLFEIQIAGVGSQDSTT